jgi:hypothetical protein
MKNSDYRYFISAKLDADKHSAFGPQNQMTEFPTFHSAWCEMNNMRQNRDSGLTDLSIIEAHNNRYTHEWKFEYE